MSGHLGPQDVMLLADETTDQQGYLERTLPSLIKLAFQNLAKNDGLLLLSQVELEKERDARLYGPLSSDDDFVDEETEN